MWSYEDALRPVSFPDVSPSLENENAADARPNSFAMCAGELIDAYKPDSDLFDCVCTIFFIDTAANPLAYIRCIWRLLKPNGRWLKFVLFCMIYSSCLFFSFGPLTYHFENEDEASLELPFEAIVSLIKAVGFEIVTVEGKNENPPSAYTRDKNSMLKYQYNCGFFEVVKPGDEQNDCE